MGGHRLSLVTADPMFFDNGRISGHCAGYGGSRPVHQESDKHLHGFHRSYCLTQTQKPQKTRCTSTDRPREGANLTGNRAVCTSYMDTRTQFSEICASIYTPREVGGKVVDEDARFIAPKLTMGNV